MLLLNITVHVYISLLSFLLCYEQVSKMLSGRVDGIEGKIYMVNLRQAENYVEFREM